MAASILPFLDRRANAQGSSGRRNGLRSRAEDVHLSQSSQKQAHRIVAQIEREITDQAYNRAQLRLSHKKAKIADAKDPIGIGSRILHAIRTFANCA